MFQLTQRAPGRELGIPCVVSATMNGDTGTVTILEHAAGPAVR